MMMMTANPIDGSPLFAMEDWAQAGDTTNIAEEARKLFSSLADGEAGGGPISVPLADGGVLKLSGERWSIPPHLPLFSCPMV